MKVWLGLALGCAAAAAQPAGEIRGTVVDALGGEPLARVEIQLAGEPYRTVTDAAGHFSVAAIAPGEYTLNVSTIGYRMIKKPFLLPGEVKDLGHSQPTPFAIPRQSK